MDKNELKLKSRNLEPVMRIGKNGITESVYSEVDKLLKKRKLIKIKILNNSPIEDKKEAIADIVSKSNSTLVSIMGNTFTLYRKS